MPDIKKEMWRKAVFNCVINPTTTLIGSEVGGIVDPQLNGLKQQIIDECLAVACADGVTFEEDFIALIDRVFAGARTIASMRQDLMKGRKTEIDYMNGAVVDLGAKYGIDCPVNAAMTTMIRYLESKGAGRLVTFHSRHAAERLVERDDAGEDLASARATASSACSSVRSASSSDRKVGGAFAVAHARDAGGARAFARLIDELAPAAAAPRDTADQRVLGLLERAQHGLLVRGRRLRACRPRRRAAAPARCRDRTPPS